MELEIARKKIDEIDEDILKLFLERMKTVGEIAKYKEKNSLPVFNRGREREILARVSEKAGDGMEFYTKLLFQTLFDISRSQQTMLINRSGAFGDTIRTKLGNTSATFPTGGIVACQGIEGAYSQEAADKLFPLGRIMYFKSFDGVFSAVENGLADFGVLPVENSSFGTVGEVYDLMRGYNFSIIRSVKLRIEHKLLTHVGVCADDITEVYSHPQAIGQCGRWLSAHRNIKVNICENTAVAARLVAQSGRRDIAAIASAGCAELYGLEAQNIGVMNSESNFTRFICIAKNGGIYPGADRISVMLTLPHTPGSLYSMISKFAALGINLTKLESRPIEGSDFEFRFFIDFEASLLSDGVISLIDELRSVSDGFVFLGAYREV